MSANSTNSTMQKSSSKKEKSWQGKPCHKVIAGGVCIQWTAIRKDAEEAYKSAIGAKEWWFVQPDGSARLQAKA